MAKFTKASFKKLLGDDRRNFLRNAAAAGTAALLAPTEMARALEVSPVPPAVDSPAEVRVLTEGRSGSDFMVDVIKSLDIEYVCSNPGSTFRGLMESIVNYGGNKKPEFIICTHEESAVAMGNGYAKIEGKPLAVLFHGTVGLQHSSMAIYNAFGDRAPVYIMIGNVMDATFRRQSGDWNHSAQDIAAMVREYVKWDDTPVSLQHFAESGVRAYKIAMTPPMGPVLLVADRQLQEPPIPEGAELRIPKLPVTMPPQGDSGSVAEVARLLVQAENPVIALDHATRTQAGMDRLVELAELLQAPVIDRWGRMNFPTRHPLSQSVSGRRVIADADVILGLELIDFFGLINSPEDQVQELTSRRITKPGVKLISINSGDLYQKSVYQNFQRFTDVDLAIAADVETTMPSLIEAVKRQITAARKTAFQARGAKLAVAHKEGLEKARADATYAWDATPISTARLCMETWGAIKDEDWSLVSPGGSHISSWPLRLWPFDKHYQYIGGIGGGGLGYCPAAAVGAALANRKYGRLSVNIQCDGEMLFGPSILWTAAHHRIPLLTVMHNNRAYHEEVMEMQRMSDRRERGIDRANIPAAIEDPHIDFAKLAQGFGVYSEGPITDPKDLGPAIRRAVAVVKRGEPALVDVVTQPR
jgi:acetolactate synthase-1/2/3 large subunit